MRGAESIQVYHRDNGRLETEQVLGEGWVRFLYENCLGRFLADRIFKQRVFSRFYGWMQNRPFSAGKISKVADELGIDLSEMEQSVESYQCFNDFFTRALKKEARPIDTDAALVISPCDARLLVIPSVDRGAPVRIKGSDMMLEALLGSSVLADRFSNGTMFIYRLCPADYHRFHFPEDCIPGFPNALEGPLHSVNPIALASGLKILDTNLRHRTLLNTESELGDMAMIEIGAMCVGSVVQNFVPNVPAKRGDEKGMFRFGGSTVIVLYLPERVVVDDDILEQSEQGIETLVRLGMAVGKRSNC